MTTNYIGMNKNPEDQLTKKIEINDCIARRLRFKSEKQLKKYMKKNGIDESNFKNENELVSYIAEYMIDDESDILAKLTYLNC